MNHFQPSYMFWVGIAVLVALLFPVTRHIRDRRERRQYYLLQMFTLVGAVIGAKLSVLFNDHRWPWGSVPDWENVLWSGRSITGALILGFLFAEIAKPLMGYRLPPNDRFATLLPFTIGLGRIGCWASGCCLGIVNGGWCALRGADGIPRYPVPMIELIFQLAVGGFFYWCLRRGRLRGRLFSVYLVAYGIFRFAMEFVRETPKTFGDYSGYQLLSLVMIALGLIFLVRRTLVPLPNFESPPTTTAGTRPA